MKLLSSVLIWIFELYVFTSTYDSSLIGKVTEANTSGLAETMTLTFTDKDGNTATKEISLSANANTQQLAAAEIVSQLDGTTIKINDIDYSLAATDNGNGTYSITSEGNESAIQSMISSAPVLDIEPSTALSSYYSRNNVTTNYTFMGTANVNAGLSSGTKITLNITNTSNQSGTVTITANADYSTASDAASFIASQLNGQLIDIGGKNFAISSDSSGASFSFSTSSYSYSDRFSSISASAKDADEKDIDLIADISTDDSSDTTRYSWHGYGTVTNGNDNAIKEKITFTFHDTSSDYEYADPITGETYTEDTIGAIRGSRLVNNEREYYWYKRKCTDTIEIEVDPGTTAEEIATKISEAVTSKGSIKFSDNNYEKEWTLTPSNPTTTSYDFLTNEYNRSYFSSSIDLVRNVTVEADAAGSTTASSDPGYPKEINTAASSALL